MIQARAGTPFGRCEQSGVCADPPGERQLCLCTPDRSRHTPIRVVPRRRRATRQLHLTQKELLRHERNLFPAVPRVYTLSKNRLNCQG